MNNIELRELKLRVESLPVLENRLMTLEKTISAANEEMDILLKAFEKEKRDVEKIKRDSFSVMLIKFMGRYEERVEKEIGEELGAKLKYDKIVERCKQLQEDKGALIGRIEILKKEKREYQNELSQRAMQLKYDHGALGQQYFELEEKAGKVSKELIEIKEAETLGVRVINKIAAIREHLKSAENWATFDVFTRGGIISHMAKYEHLDTAASECHHLTALLEDFKKELRDVKGFSAPVHLGIDTGTRVFDFWFDNIFTDLSIRDKIRRDQEQIDLLDTEVKKALEELKNAKKLAGETLYKIEVTKEELIINL